MSASEPQLLNVVLLGAEGWIGGAIWRYITPRRANVIPLRLGGASLHSAIDHVRAQLQPAPIALVNAARSQRGYVSEAVGVVRQGLDLAESLEARYLQVGSAAEYGNHAAPIDESVALNPASEYGHLKATESRFVIEARESQSVEACVLRPFTILGPHPRVGTLFHDIKARAEAAIRHGGACFVDQGSYERDFVGLDFFCEAVWRVMLSDQFPEALNVCSGSSQPIHQLATVVCAQFGQGCEVFDKQVGSGIPSVVGNPDLLARVLNLRETRSLCEIVVAAL